MGIPSADLENEQILVKMATEHYTNRVGTKALSIVLEVLPEGLLSIKAPLSYDLNPDHIIHMGFALLSLHEFAPSVRFTIQGFGDTESPVLTAQTVIPVMDSRLTASQLGYYLFDLSTEIDGLDPVIRHLNETGELDMGLMPPLPNENLMEERGAIVALELVQTLKSLGLPAQDGHNDGQGSIGKKKK